jgi:aspartyl-tRNA(Asn)/glutamyl-tRNA(Gln) amidotransferase subunit B
MSAIEYEPVMGLEIHAELMTASKMFCTCPVIDVIQAEKHAQQNTAICPVCTGLPGALPVINQAALEMAIRVGLALNCSINETSWFARKNYFYPDLPKGYQISQFDNPVCHDGYVDLDLGEDKIKRVRIRRAHLEEDTAKLTHPEGKPYSLADYNRSSVPLLEIVTEPDIDSVEVAVAYGNKIRSILRYLGVNSGDMEKGVLRFEANISIRPKGSKELNTRTEIKNLNSFTTLDLAARFEINRQIELVKSGKEVIQATLGWDPTKQAIYIMRLKEHAHEYRYFPEPDLPAFKIERSLVERLRDTVPELEDEKRARFRSELKLSVYDAKLLASERPTAEYFEAAVKAYGKEPKVIANWMTNEVFRLMSDKKLTIADIKTTPEQLAALVCLVEAKEVGATNAKEVLAEIITTGQDPVALVDAKDLRQKKDSGELSRIIAEVLAKNEKQVQQYLGGKETVFNSLIGQVMKATQGKASPDLTRAILKEQLDALKK